MNTLARRFHNATFRFISSAPASVRTAVLNAFPSLIDTFCAPGSPFVFKKYLGEFHVCIDRTFPIECEMCSAGFEPVTMGIIARFVRAGDTCFDVGANVGAITFALAQRAGKKGRVYSFEPGPPTFQRLRKNLSMNPQLDGIVVPVPRGVGEKPGALRWRECADNRGNAELGAEGTEVEVITLDDFVAEQKITRVDFMKVDVEGMELEVFRGARNIIAKYQPAIYFETMEQFEKRRGFPVFAEIENLLGEFGYALFAPGEKGKITRADSRNLATNTLALPATRQPKD